MYCCKKPNTSYSFVNSINNVEIQKKWNNMTKFKKHRSMVEILCDKILSKK